MENNMDKTIEMKELIEQLNKASEGYYKNDAPIMSDKKYDELYDKLEKLERETDITFAGSPTQRVQGFILDGLSKVTHSKPMLSAKKTKDIEEIKEFVGLQNVYGSYKLDGLTLVVRYSNGEFIQAITRGDGENGEDVTHQAKMISNLPMKIPYKKDLEIRGECVISWENFNKINSELEVQYAHPRNLAAGSIRTLDTDVTKSRMLEFIAFECVTDIGYEYKTSALDNLFSIGFTVVTVADTLGDIDRITELLTPENSKVPVDGLIFEFDDIAYSKSLGATGHHENCRIAYKWNDETSDTVLKGVEWSCSRNSINPVALFDTVLLDGTQVGRASVHNVSIVKELRLGIGDTISVYKANMIIPQIHENKTRSNTIEIPKKCPSCGHDTEIHNMKGTETLHCSNLNCKSKLLGRLSLFCDKNSMNIVGLSEATLSRFIENGWLTCLSDVYELRKHYLEMKDLDGFGKKSTDKLLESIEKSKNVTLAKFIRSFGIPLIGRTVSKELSNFCNGSVTEFIDKMDGKFDFTEMNGFGEEMQASLLEWWKNGKDEFVLVTSWTDLIEREKEASEQDTDASSSETLKGKNFCITGKLIEFANRDALVADIESNGGKFVSGVSKNTHYLINNDTTSSSGKNKKAKDLGIAIISEEDYKRLVSGKEL